MSLLQARFVMNSVKMGNDGVGETKGARQNSKRNVTLTIVSARDERNAVLFCTIPLPSCHLLVCTILATCSKARGKMISPVAFRAAGYTSTRRSTRYMCISIAWCSTACDMHPRSTNRRLWQLTDPFVTVCRCRPVAIAIAEANRNKFSFTRCILFAQCNATYKLSSLP